MADPEYETALTVQTGRQLMEEMEAKRSQISKVLTEALMFYADETNYTICFIPEPPTAPIKVDRGARARDALERLSKLLITENPIA